MADMAVMVIDPGGFRFAQLVDDRHAVRHVIPLLVQRLGLPVELHYQLIPSATGRALPDDVTLAGAGVGPGAELQLRPVRDGLLAKLLDRLYEEAKDYVRDRLWALARQQLEALFRLEPRYPDPQRLRDMVAQQVGAAPASPPPLPTEALPASSLPPALPPPPPLPSPAAASSQTGTALGCLVLVGVIAFGIVWFRPWELGGPRLGTGDVQVTLRWQNAADLDLHVIDPNGEEISFANRKGKRSAGQLDVDANDRCKNNVMAKPVENVFWPSGGGPRGEFRVQVRYAVECEGSGPTAFEVTVRLEGQVRERKQGTLQRAGENTEVVQFRY